MAPAAVVETTDGTGVKAHSHHVADPTLKPFLAPSFDPADYLNATLPPLTCSLPGASRQAAGAGEALSAVSSQAQTLLSQLSAHTSRLSHTLTQLTDEILRSGSRLAYEVDLLRGETLGLAEALTDTLKEDIERFVPAGLAIVTSPPSREGEVEHGGEAPLEADPAVPQFLSQLRMLSLVKERLEAVIKIFGEAMEWTLPPSEVSLTSSFISVSAPEAGSESYSREEKGHAVAKQLRQEIADLLQSGKTGEDGLEAAIKRVEELRELAHVWKGTAEEKARVKFVDGLIKLIEDRQRALVQEAEEKKQRTSPPKPPRNMVADPTNVGEGEAPEQSRFAWAGRQGGYAFIDQLQKMRADGTQIQLPLARSLSSPLRLPTDLSLGFGHNSLGGLESIRPVGDDASNEDIPPFHLLIPASQTNPNFCKTFVSTLILHYPPPTVINFNRTFTSDTWDNGTHVGKIRGVLEYLTGNPRIQPNDLVLIVDGYDVWFQLPPELLIQRYHHLVRANTAKLREQYGQGWRGSSTGYVNSVIFGADKLCWPNPAQDAACMAIPKSSLSKIAWGPETDRDPTGFHTRPRWLNSGAVIGPAAAVRAVYERALYKVEDEGVDNQGDQYIFAEIFGEQEYQRGLRRAAGFTPSWTRWFRQAGKMSDEDADEVDPRAEYGIGLDYEMALFQTMTHSHDDVEFIAYNDTRAALPQDILAASPPFGGPVTVPAQFAPISPTLYESWLTVPLATNLHVPTVPALLHFNGDKAYLETWWSKMWYQPHA
ncbi:MAG: hypothetical protein M1838_005080, partial [Thelocarpon superellum]